MLRITTAQTDIDLVNSGYRYAWSLCSNQQDAEDLVHDAWLRLIKRYKVTPEKALLFRTIRNLYIDQYRRNRRAAAAVLDDWCQPQDDYKGSIESAFIESEEMQIHLDKLRDVEREALFLSVVEGYTADEISVMTDDSRGQVLSLIHRSKAKLKNWITGQDAGAANVVSLSEREKKS